jgi:hypothetical protein
MKVGSPRSQPGGRISPLAPALGLFLALLHLSSSGCTQRKGPPAIFQEALNYAETCYS